MLYFVWWLLRYASIHISCMLDANDGNNLYWLHLCTEFISPKSVYIKSGDGYKTIAKRTTYSIRCIVNATSWSYCSNSWFSDIDDKTSYTISYGTSSTTQNKAATQLTIVCKRCDRSNTAHCMSPLACDPSCCDLYTTAISASVVVVVVAAAAAAAAAAVTAKSTVIAVALRAHCYRYNTTATSTSDCCYCSSS